MTDPRTDQLAALRQLIASQEEQQSRLGLDLSDTITALRVKLAELEQGQLSAPSSASVPDGAVDAQATVAGPGAIAQGPGAVAAGAGGIAAESIGGHSTSFGRTLRAGVRS